MSGRATWSSRSMDLPPKMDYSDIGEAGRGVMLALHMVPIREEFALYKRTRNGAHMWRCFQLWRRLMPDDLPLPRELLAYLDDCADVATSETDADALKRGMRLSKPPGFMAEHGGGPSGDAAATATRKQQRAMMFVADELFKAQFSDSTPKGYKTAIYQAAAARFGYSVSRIQRLAGDWGITEFVASQIAKAESRKRGN